MCAASNRLEMIDNVAKTTPQALNLGLKKSNADIRIIFGAHAVMEPDYVSQCVRILEENTDVGCVGGIIQNEYLNDRSKIIGKAMASPFGVGNVRFRTGGKDGHVDTVAFGAYRKEVFDDVGYFDEDLVRNQDDEFNYRVTQGGFGIYYSEKIRSKYFVRSSLQKLWKQYDQYGYWKVFVNRKHGVVTTLRQLAPPLFVGGLIVGAVAIFIAPVMIVPYTIAILLYLTMALFFALREESSLLAIELVVVFAILHGAYGIGYLRGIVHFLILGRMPSQKSQVSTR
jgi:cellulose synthase/poly-beta-1,6-N-acetylglucosamine synthase-like glycosyltransferase